MGLKSKLMLVTAALVIAAICVGMVIFYSVIYKSFEDTEQSLAEENTRRIKNIIENQITLLNDKTTDWAVWDDTYDYLRGNNPGFAEEHILTDNLDSSGFQLLNLNWIVFKSNQEQHFRGYFFDESRIYSFSEADNAYINSPLALLMRDMDHNSVDGIHGIEKFNDQLVLFSLRRVFNNEADSASSGYLLFGVNISKELAETLSGLVLQPLAIEPMASFDDIPGDRWTVNANRKELDGYFVLNNFFLEPIAVVRFTMQRTLTMKASQVFVVFVLSMCAVALFFFYLIYYFSNEFLIRRIQSLDNEIHRITSGGSISSSIKDKSNDEIGNLTNNFNHMIGRLAEAIDTANEASDAKTRFLANFSHELRTPLTAMIGYAELLTAEKNLDAHQARALDAIKSNSEVLLAMINNILDISRIEHDQIALKSERCSLSSIMDSVVNLMQLRAFPISLSIQPC
jgi:signal transduction histidine kinase